MPYADRLRARGTGVKPHSSPIRSRPPNPRQTRPMPPRTPRPCPRPGCPNLRPCPDHTRPDNRTDRTQSRTVYNSTQWKNLRRQILELNPDCNGYPEGICHNGATEVDHVLPVEDGGDPFDETNLQPLCKRCHSRKTADDVKRRREARGEGRGDREVLGQEDRRVNRARNSGSLNLSVPTLLPSPTTRRRRKKV